MWEYRTFWCLWLDVCHLSIQIHGHLTIKLPTTLHIYSTTSSRGNDFWEKKHRELRWIATIKRWTSHKVHLTWPWRWFVSPLSYLWHDVATQLPEHVANLGKKPWIHCCFVHSSSLPLSSLELVSSLPNILSTIFIVILILLSPSSLLLWLFTIVIIIVIVSIVTMTT